MSYTLQMSHHSGAPWFPALLLISQWAPSPFLVSACPKCSAHSSFHLFPGAPLLCWTRNKVHLCCPHLSLLPWHSSGWQHCRERLYMGCACRISDACHPWCQQLQEFPTLAKHKESCPVGHPTGQGMGTALHNVSQSTARET